MDREVSTLWANVFELGGSIKVMIIWPKCIYSLEILASTVYPSDRRCIITVDVLIQSPPQKPQQNTATKKYKTFDRVETDCVSAMFGCTDICLAVNVSIVD